MRPSQAASSWKPYKRVGSPHTRAIDADFKTWGNETLTKHVPLSSQSLPRRHLPALHANAAPMTRCTPCQADERCSHEGLGGCQLLVSHVQVFFSATKYGFSADLLGPWSRGWSEETDRETQSQCQICMEAEAVGQRRPGLQQLTIPRGKTGMERDSDSYNCWGSESIDIGVEAQLGSTGSV